LSEGVLNEEQALIELLAHVQEVDEVVPLISLLLAKDLGFQDIHPLALNARNPSFINIEFRPAFVPVRNDTVPGGAMDVIERATKEASLAAWRKPGRCHRGVFFGTARLAHVVSLCVDRMRAGIRSTRALAWPLRARGPDGNGLPGRSAQGPEALANNKGVPLAAAAAKRCQSDTRTLSRHHDPDRLRSRVTCALQEEAAQLASDVFGLSGVDVDKVRLGTLIVFKKVGGLRGVSSQQCLACCGG